MMYLFSLRIENWLLSYFLMSNKDNKVLNKLVDTTCICALVLTVSVSASVGANIYNAKIDWTKIFGDALKTFIHVAMRSLFPKPGSIKIYVFFRENVDIEVFSYDLLAFLKAKVADQGVADIHLEECQVFSDERVAEILHEYLRSSTRVLVEDKIHQETEEPQVELGFSQADFILSESILALFMQMNKYCSAEYKTAREIRKAADEIGRLINTYFEKYGVSVQADLIPLVEMCITNIEQDREYKTLVSCVMFCDGRNEKILTAAEHALSRLKLENVV